LRALEGIPLLSEQLHALEELVRKAVHARADSFLRMAEHEFRVTTWTTTGTRAPVAVRSWQLDDYAIEAGRLVERPVKADLPLVKLATYGDRPNSKGSLRWAGNILTITGVECDYDEGVMSLAEAASKLQAAGIKAMLFTTYSHTAASPRFRIFAPVSVALPLARREALVGRINGVLGGVLANESFTDGQCFYIGHRTGATDAEYKTTTGRFIDLCSELDSGAIGKPAPTRTELSVASYANNPSTETAKRALSEAVKGIEACPNGQKYPRIRSLCWGIAGFVKGGFLDEGEAHDAIIEAADRAGAEDMGRVEKLFSSAMENAPPLHASSEDAADHSFEDLGPDEEALAKGGGPSELTEEATARAFARDNAERLRFDCSEKAWYLFNPADGWEPDAKNRGLNLARKYVSAACLNPAFTQSDIKAAKHIRFARAIFDAGTSDPHMVMTATDWNNNPMVLGVPGGYVDLTTGDLHPVRASDLIRRRTAVAPAPRGTPAPLWTRFLDQATAGDTELQAYLMRLLGYWLTGAMNEEKISFFYGSGGNGKGVLVRTASGIMGEYAYQAPAELFKADSRTNREYQLAKVEGQRLVIASETESKSALAEAFVKELSGNEGKINARHPYGRPFEFRSVAKLLIVGNHAPQLQGRTEAMERRLQVVPFNHVPASPDRHLKDKLEAEWPAILRMAIDGALSWQQRGLGTCRAIEGASRSYFAEQDTLGQWIEQCCDVGPDKQAKAMDVLVHFNEFARTRGEEQVDAKVFKEAMLRKPGFASVRASSGNMWRGLSLRIAEPESWDL
jgi:P4 family phage/plasmid primase-like protien